MKYYDSWKPSRSTNCDSTVSGFMTQRTSLLIGKTRSGILIAGQILALVVASPTHAAEVAVDSGPIRLQSPNRGIDAREENNQTIAPARSEQQKSAPQLPPYQPSEFERYVQRNAGAEVDIRRFGSELMSPVDRNNPADRNNLAQEASSQIPLDYLINSGDELQVSLWGSVDADLRLSVDRSGRITLPRIGPIMVAGLRYADLEAAIDKRVAQVFRNYKLSVALGRLRSIRIYVTGFTQRPGAYTVNSLSTLVNALMHAGGPSSAGSFRQIELRRGGKSITTFDFYELLINGNKSADRLLQAEDVIHIGPVGVQVALIGSVNKPAIFEIKPGESVDNLLSMAGGFTAVADRSRLTVEHLDARNDVRISELALPQQRSQQPRNGDLLRAFSAVDMSLPQHRQSRRIKIEGEVHRPGEFILPANSTVSDAIKAAGGLTPGAFLYGTEFSRESVRILQQENYDRVLRDLETEFSRSSSTQKAITADEAAAQAARAQSSTKLIERLRSLRPNGRIVLQLPPGATSLPDLQLEDGDRLSIPARPTTVGVFGSVFNAGSYLHINGGTITDFLKLAGGTTRGADTNSAFVLRANGSVVSARQRTGWLMGGGGLDGVGAEPGDTVFVPEELNKTTFIQEAKEWTQIFAQFGLGIAAIRTLTK